MDFIESEKLKNGGRENPFTPRAATYMGNNGKLGAAKVDVWICDGLYYFLLSDGRALKQGTQEYRDFVSAEKRGV